MKKLTKLFWIVPLLLAWAAPLRAQTATTQTTLSTAITDAAPGIQMNIVVASATGIASNSQLMIGREMMCVTGAYPGSGTTVPVIRGCNSTVTSTHLANELIWVATAAQAPYVFRTYDKAGSCTPTNERFLPQINTATGNIQGCNCVQRFTSGSVGQCQFSVWSGNSNSASADKNPGMAVTLISDVNYTVLASDEVVAFDTLSAARTVTIGAMSIPGKTLVILNGNTNRTLTISGLINANGSYTVAPNAALRLVWSGSVWYQY